MISSDKRRVRSILENLERRGLWSGSLDEEREGTCIVKITFLSDLGFLSQKSDQFCGPFFNLGGDGLRLRIGFSVFNDIVSKPLLCFFLFFYSSFSLYSKRVFSIFLVTYLSPYSPSKSNLFRWLTLSLSYLLFLSLDYLKSE